MINIAQDCTTRVAVCIIKYNYISETYDYFSFTIVRAYPNPGSQVYMPDIINDFIFAAYRPTPLNAIYSHYNN